MIHLSLNLHSLDVWLTIANSGHSYFTQQHSFVNKYFQKWRTSHSTLTPLTIDLIMGTVATLTSLYNDYLLTSLDVVPLMKTAGVVDNSGHCIYSIGLKCFWNCLSLFHLVFYIYIYIIHQFSLKYVAFESTLLNYAKPLRNWTFQRFVIYQ